MDDKLLAEGFIMSMKVTSEVAMDCLTEVLRQQKENKCENLPDPGLIETAIHRFTREREFMDEHSDEIIQFISKDLKTNYKS